MHLAISRLSQSSLLTGTAYTHNYHLGFGPTSVSARRAILLCKFHFSTATATIKLPKNSINVSCNAKYEENR